MVLVKVLLNLTLVLLAGRQFSEVSTALLKNYCNAIPEKLFHTCCDYPDLGVETIFGSCRTRVAIDAFERKITDRFDCRTHTCVFEELNLTHSDGQLTANKFTDYLDSLEFNVSLWQAPLESTIKTCFGNLERFGGDILDTLIQKPFSLNEYLCEIPHAYLAYCFYINLFASCPAEKLKPTSSCVSSQNLIKRCRNNMDLLALWADDPQV